MGTAQKPINLISVCYNDRAIAWDKVWNPNVKIQDTAQSPNLSPFATLGDLSALQNLKVKVERDKLYRLAEMAQYYNKKLGIKQSHYKNNSGKIQPNLHRITNIKGQMIERACKNLGITLLRDDKDSQTRRPTIQMSLAEWELIRAEMYKMLFNRKAYNHTKEWAEKIWQGQNVNTKKHTRLKIIDWFFNNVKEYETEKILQRAQVQTALFNLFDKPAPDEQNFIATRILKNNEIMPKFLRRVEQVFFYNREATRMLAEKKASGENHKNAIKASKGDIRMTLMNIFGLSEFRFKVNILTLRQIKAMLVILEYFSTLQKTGRNADYVVSAIFNIKRFLANQQEWERKYQVAYTENKVYRSLWL